MAVGKSTRRMCELEHITKCCQPAVWFHCLFSLLVMYSCLALEVPLSGNQCVITQLDLHGSLQNLAVLKDIKAR